MKKVVRPMGTTTKALSLLNFFNVTRPEITLAEFSRLAERDKATVLRHLAELEFMGYVERHPPTRAYRLGTTVLRLATIRETCFPLRASAAPMIEMAAQDIGELVHFTMLQGATLNQIYHFDPHLHGTAVYFDPGELVPLHATASGLAILAFQKAELLEEIVDAGLDKHTDHTPVDAETLGAAVERTRRAGFALSERTFDPDVVSYALPVFASGPEAIGSVSVAVPALRATEDARKAHLPRLIQLSHAITKSLGGTPASS